ncbi:hypothetical protein DIPPA_28626 [Diplonema papillatum]|nr:hypothetical protein DIPPA_28626 [Diplonema papillatum]
MASVSESGTAATSSQSVEFVEKLSSSTDKRRPAAPPAGPGGKEATSSQTDVASSSSSAGAEGAEEARGLPQPLVGNAGSSTDITESSGGSKDPAARAFADVSFLTLASRPPAHGEEDAATDLASSSFDGGGPPRRRPPDGSSTDIDSSSGARSPALRASRRADENSEGASLLGTPDASPASAKESSRQRSAAALAAELSAVSSLAFVQMDASGTHVGHRERRTKEETELSAPSSLGFGQLDTSGAAKELSGRLDTDFLESSKPGRQPRSRQGTQASASSSLAFAQMDEPGSTKERLSKPGRQGSRQDTDLTVASSLAFDQMDESGSHRIEPRSTKERSRRSTHGDAVESSKPGRQGARQDTDLTVASSLAFDQMDESGSHRIEPRSTKERSRRSTHGDAVESSKPGRQGARQDTDLTVASSLAFDQMDESGSHRIEPGSTKERSRRSTHGDAVESSKPGRQGARQDTDLTVASSLAFDQMDESGSHRIEPGSTKERSRRSTHGDAVESSKPGRQGARQDTDLTVASSLAFDQMDESGSHRIEPGSTKERSRRSTHGDAVESSKPDRQLSRQDTEYSAVSSLAFAQMDESGTSKPKGKPSGKQAADSAGPSIEPQRKQLRRSSHGSDVLESSKPPRREPSASSSIAFAQLSAAEKLEESSQQDTASLGTRAEGRRGLKKTSSSSTLGGSSDDPGRKRKSALSGGRDAGSSGTARRPSQHRRSEEPAKEAEEKPRQPGDERPAKTSAPAAALAAEDAARSSDAQSGSDAGEPSREQTGAHGTAADKQPPGPAGGKGGHGAPAARGGGWAGGGQKPAVGSSHGGDADAPAALLSRRPQGKARIAPPQGLDAPAGGAADPQSTSGAAAAARAADGAGPSVPKHEGAPEGNRPISAEGADDDSRPSAPKHEGTPEANRPISAKGVNLDSRSSAPKHEGPPNVNRPIGAKGAERRPSVPKREGTPTASADGAAHDATPPSPAGARPDGGRPRAPYRTPRPETDTSSSLTTTRTYPAAGGDVVTAVRQSPAGCESESDRELSGDLSDSDDLGGDREATALLRLERELGEARRGVRKMREKSREERQKVSELAEDLEHAWARKQEEIWREKQAGIEERENRRLDAEFEETIRRSERLAANAARFARAEENDRRRRTASGERRAATPPPQQPRPAAKQNAARRVPKTRSKTPAAKATFAPVLQQLAELRRELRSWGARKPSKSPPPRKAAGRLPAHGSKPNSQAPRNRPVAAAPRRLPRAGSGSPASRLPTGSDGAGETRPKSGTPESSRTPTPQASRGRLPRAGSGSPASRQPTGSDAGETRLNSGTPESSRAPTPQAHRARLPRAGSGSPASRQPTGSDGAAAGEPRPNPGTPESSRAPQAPRGRLPRAGSGSPASRQPTGSDSAAAGEPRPNSGRTPSPSTRTATPPRTPEAALRSPAAATPPRLGPAKLVRSTWAPLSPLGRVSAHAGRAGGRSTAVPAVANLMAKRGGHRPQNDTGYAAMLRERASRRSGTGTRTRTPPGALPARRPPWSTSGSSSDGTGLRRKPRAGGKKVHAHGPRHPKRRTRSSSPGSARSASLDRWSTGERRGDTQRQGARRGASLDRWGAGERRETGRRGDTQRQGGRQASPPASVREARPRSTSAGRRDDTGNGARGGRKGAPPGGKAAAAAAADGPADAGRTRSILRSASQPAPAKPPGYERYADARRSVSPLSSRGRASPPAVTFGIEDEEPPAPPPDLPPGVRLYHEAVEVAAIKDAWAARQRAYRSSREHEDYPFKPEISKATRRSQTGKTPPGFGGLFREKRRRAREKQPWLTGPQKELLECTFRPEINRGPAKGGQQGEPAHLRLYDDAEEFRGRRYQASRLLHDHWSSLANLTIKNPMTPPAAPSAVVHALAVDTERIRQAHYQRHEFQAILSPRVDDTNTHQPQATDRTGLTHTGCGTPPAAFSPRTGSTPLTYDRLKIEATHLPPSRWQQQGSGEGAYEVEGEGEGDPVPSRKSTVEAWLNSLVYAREKQEIILEAVRGEMRREASRKADRRHWRKHAGKQGANKEDADDGAASGADNDEHSGGTQVAADPNRRGSAASALKAASELHAEGKIRQEKRAEVVRATRRASQAQANVGHYLDKRSKDLAADRKRTALWRVFCEVSQGTDPATPVAAELFTQSALRYAKVIAPVLVRTGKRHFTFEALCDACETSTFGPLTVAAKSPELPAAAPPGVRKTVSGKVHAKLHKEAVVRKQRMADLVEAKGYDKLPEECTFKPKTRGYRKPPESPSQGTATPAPCDRSQDEQLEDAKADILDRLKDIIASSIAAQKA